MVQRNACGFADASYPIITLLDVHSRMATHNHLLKVDNADEADEAESHQEEIDRRRSLLQEGSGGSGL